MTQFHPRQRQDEATPVLELRDIRISYSSVDAPPVLAVEHLSLCVREGEFLALIGPSGCGKSSTLNAMAGLTPVDAGEILLHGQPVHRISDRVGYISQADHLLPWRTVLDNVALGLELRGMSKKLRHARARELIASMGLGGFETNYPHELSGGMKKRVTIARVLAIEPEILFMDEPFAPLDVFTRERLQEDIMGVWAATGQTIVYVTHDLTEAISLADRVLLFGGRPGQVRGEYPVPLARPRQVMDAKFDDQFVSLEKTILTDLRAALRETGGPGDGN
ncbi:MAG: transporter ATP-binding protein [Firmicutes bacterium]|nr:transporter ATP-binding protein [Bacillota bacterium]